MFYIALTILLLWVNLTGLTLVTRHLISHYPLARVAGVLGFCVVFFFIEHFHGLGQLAWLWPITTAASLACLYRQRTLLPEFLRNEWPFILSFLYIFAWRFTFPDLSPTSERITDLTFISNYLPGATLPPVDNWFPPYSFDYYYGFQFYSAALMGRFFGLEAGVTYQLSFCVIFALSASLVWWIASQMISKFALRLLLFVAIVMGGSGLSIFMPFLISNEHPGDPALTQYHQHHTLWAGQRFIGSSDRHINTPLGQRLFEISPENKSKPVPQLPLETFGYYGFLGDYHPALSSFLLLFLAVACLVWLDKSPHDRQPQILLISTVPLMLAANTWLFPFQFLLVLSWLLWRITQRQSPNWIAIGTAGLLVGFLLYPFLSYFTTSGTGPALRWVLDEDITPRFSFLALHWPLVILLLVALPLWREKNLVRFFVPLFIVFYLIAENLYVDDLSVGEFNRTNSTMKWWGWLFAGATLTWGAAALAATTRWIRWPAIFALSVLAAYSFLLCSFWVTSTKHHAGQWQGHAWMTSDETQSAMLTWLRLQPRGIVLESRLSNGYNRNPALTINAGHSAFIGWTNHLVTWGYPAAHLMTRSNAVDRFYQGEKANPLRWLEDQNIDFVIWNKEDNIRRASAREKIDQKISSHYHWQTFGSSINNELIGIWTKQEPVTP
ncbi:MAG TPA: DUF2298 domain-containing protein [Cellvibrionaceae bacterium]